MLNKNLVILSYGKETEYSRAIFCILSFSAWANVDWTTFRIVVYTDNPIYFQQYLKHLPIVYVSFTDELRSEMLAGSDYIHRIKVGVIAFTFNMYPNEDLLFVDSDTFFTENPMLILNGFKSGKSFMHKREYTFEEGLRFFNTFHQGKHPKLFIDYISNRDFMIQDRILHFDKQDYSWNSGVLGLHASFSSFIPDVFKLTDEFYLNSHWFISEQLAFALILQKTTDIVPTDNIVVHYWGKRQKLMLDEFLEELFNHSKARLTEKDFIRNLSKKMKKLVKDDLVLEQAVLALAQRHWKYGIKKSLQAILRNPVRLTAYKELLLAVK